MTRHEGRVLVWKTGPHSHNEFLQTWYELGAVGVILLLAAGCAVIGYIGRLPPANLRPFMLAQFAVFFVMAAFSWGNVAKLADGAHGSRARSMPHWLPASPGPMCPSPTNPPHAMRSPLASGERAA